MITLPLVQSLGETIKRLSDKRVIVWCTPTIAERFRVLAPWQVQIEAPSLQSVEWLLAVGGGKLIDQAKALRAENPHTQLAALPTIWGSGAEASPIAVLSSGGRKVFRMGRELLPNLVIYVPEFRHSLTPDLVRSACGDSWAHALEGFLSPLASEATRKDLAEVIKRMIEVGVKNDERWFKLSALACAGQAMSSVGLVHGMAHVLEGPSGFGHARLCATCLLPVMNFNKMKSPKWPLLEQHGIGEGEILGSLNEVFVANDFEQLKPFIQQHWRDILRDPCTRTNSALLRPDDLAFFLDFRA